MSRSKNASAVCTHVWMHGQTDGQVNNTVTTTDSVVGLRLTQHKIGHFGDVSPTQSVGMVWKN